MQPLFLLFQVKPSHAVSPAQSGCGASSPGLSQGDNADLPQIVVCDPLPLSNSRNVKSTALLCRTIRIFLHADKSKLLKDPKGCGHCLPTLWPASIYVN